MKTIKDNPTVLITGGAGLIGSAIIKSLNNKGITKIIVVDRLGKTDKWKNLVNLKFYSYMEVDEFETMLETAVSNNMALCDIIIHCGACSSTTEIDATYLMKNNYTFSVNLLEYAVRSNIRFIYASSAATYGNGSAGMSDDSIDNLQPLNAYGYSKHLFDQYVANREYTNKVIGLKYFNVFGPGENHKGDMRSVVAKSFQEIRNTGKMTLFQMPNIPIGRDFLYVKDAADITTWFALSENPKCGIFNVGSSIATSWDELAAYIFAGLGLEPNIQYIPMPEHLKGKYQFYTKADIGKLRNVGYSEEITPINVAVKDYITNYLVPDKRIGS